MGRGSGIQWLPLHQHLRDAGDSAAKIFDEWISESGRKLMVSQMPGKPSEQARLARGTAIFLAAVHDIGKATPSFAVMHDALANSMRSQGLAMDENLVGRFESRRTLMHALAGHIALADWFEDREEATANPMLNWLGFVIGGHHGRHGTELTNDMSATDDLYGDHTWADVRDEFIAAAQVMSGLSDADLLAISANPPAQQVQVLYSALTVYSDWFASTPDLFPLHSWTPETSTPAPVQTDDTSRPDAAWKTLGNLPQTWAPDLHGCDDADQMFATRFDVPGGKARPVQQVAFDTAHECDPASLVIIEAPMGEGKTEAGLMAAEILAARSGAGGLMFALPTQATTNKMFDRVLNWLEVTDNHLEAPEPQTLSLVHGGASNHSTFASLNLPGSPNCVGDAGDDCGAFAHAWLNRKKSTMSNFVVATIDQLLLMALTSKHLPMRHLGISGKVVVIDEAHAYDAYMNRYLDVVLEYLGSYDVPVVMLSATLPVHTRQDFIDAYVRGQSGSPDRNELVQTSLDIVPSYPAVTWFSQNGKGLHKADPISDDVTVAIRRWNENDIVLGQRLDRLLTDSCGNPSGRALVIRNTVKGAQETFETLRARFGADVTLVHARFTNGDRGIRDQMMNKTFGPTNSADTSRHIVVSTQVVEQSLDVDFDILVTDVSPTDVLFQRMGRLHRHTARNPYRPAALTKPICVLRHENWLMDNVLKLGEAGASSSFVYDNMLIYRAMLQFRWRRTVRLPQDIAKMVHEAYLWEVEGYRPENDPLIKRIGKFAGTLKWAWLKARQERADARGRASSFLLNTPLQRADHSTMAMFEGAMFNEYDGKVDAAVRDSVLPTEVILLDRVGTDFFIPSLPTIPVSLVGRKVVVGLAQADDVVAALNLCTIRVPAHVIHRERDGELLVGPQWSDGWMDVKAGDLSGIPVIALEKSRYLSYCSTRGLIVNGRFKP